MLLSMLLLIGSLAASDSSGRKLVKQDDPEYPPIAAKMALHGTVKLRVWVAPNGSVRRLEYIGGHPLLAESALKAVKAWKFESALKETTEVLEVKF